MSASSVNPSFPMLHDGITDRTVMAETMVALLPACMWAFFKNEWVFGISALFSVGFAVGIDFIYRTIFLLIGKRSDLRIDLSAPLIGLLVIFAMPSNVAIWVPILCISIAILLFRHLLHSRIASVASACTLMMLITDNYTLPASLSEPKSEPEIIEQLANGISPDLSVWELLFGKSNGAIAEICAVFLILGGLYLLIRKLIPWEVPVAALACAGAIAMPMAPSSIAYFTYVGTQLVCGGLLFGIFFLATDPPIVPLTTAGKLIYGAIIGALTVWFRCQFGIDGIYPAIAITSLFTPLIDKLTLPEIFGGSVHHDRTVSSKK